MAQVNNAEVNKALFDIEVEKRKRDKKHSLNILIWMELKIEH